MGGEEDQLRKKEEFMEDDDYDDEVELPGFRFHPTDEELVGFYLRRQLDKKPIRIELIKQIDIYKYDPWDLPKASCTGGEKEWYFFCKRGRKYRNSVRPNRVTGSGFWKATGIDKPVYSIAGQGSDCIGLKKTLVYYRGSAGKGTKTDWMMHEFRLPSLSDSSSSSPKKFTERTIPANDSWAICRIFKKTNSTAQRALSHSWVSPLPHEMNTSEILTKDGDTSKFCSDHYNIISSLTKKTSLPNQFCTNQNDPLTSTTTTSSSVHFPLDIASYKPVINPLLFYKTFDQLPIISSNNSDFMFSSSSPLEPCSVKATTTMDISSMLLSMSSSSSSVLGDFCSKAASSEVANFGGFQEQYSTNDNTGYSPVIQDGNGLVKMMMNHPNNTNLNANVVIPRVMEEPDQTNMHEAWKSNLLWDSSSCPCDHVPSTNYSTTTKCYT